MKKLKKILIIVAVVCCLLLLVGISHIYKKVNYQNLTGYEEYINGSNSGEEYATYFATSSSWADNKDAVKYYKKNSRRVGDYLITDYEDGVCINRYYGHNSKIDIPETLDGKPVIKLGGYLLKDSDTKTYNVLSAFGGIDNCKLNIPATLKYIEYDTLLEYDHYINNTTVQSNSPHIKKINVDGDNPYYCSEDGVLFTKDKKTILFYNVKEYNAEDETTYTYKVPDYVENFAPFSGFPIGFSLEFGKNIKTIDTGFYYDGFDILSYNYDYLNEYVLQGSMYMGSTIKGYKGTVAEKWAEKYYAEFIPLD